jgi:N-acyl-D-amino-acid deacylase
VLKPSVIETKRLRAMSFDIVIKNGKIIDGAGNPWYHGDIAIRDGRISKIGLLGKAHARKEIDATDLVVCPGFIDPHSHSEISIFFDSMLQSTIRQGVTTSVVGNCGDNLAPAPPEKMEELLRIFSAFAPPEVKLDSFPWNTFREYLDFMESHGCVANSAHLVGFGTVRVAGGPGFEDRAPTSAELQRMKSLVEEAMEAGAFGMSTGLVYAPQTYAKTDEIIELAKVVAEYGGLYVSHIRNEGVNVLNAVKEVIEILVKSGCIGGHIAHHKISGKPHWGTSRETLRLIEEANRMGVSLTCDQYPYNRGMTSLITALPPWVHVGGIENLLGRLQNHADRERIKRDIHAGIEGWENWIRDDGFESIYIASVKKEKWRDMQGKNLAEITRLKGRRDEWETLFGILTDEKGEAMATMESMNEEDIRRIMRGRYTMVGSDAWAVAPTGVFGYGKPHPRYYGTYPRILGKYVREERVLTLEDAIRRMTSFPAQRMGILDRGLLREGMWADVVVFDADRVMDRATFLEPHQFPEGILYVLVNGAIVVEDNKQTEKLPGRLLRRPW